MAFEFDLDNTEAVKVKSIENFKQQKPGEKARLSIISFRKMSDVIIDRKQKEAGRHFSDSEKAEIIAEADKKLAAKLNKSVSQLTEVDRLSLDNVRLMTERTHYKDGIGTIRCMSKFEGNNLSQQEICCQHLGEPSQKIGTIVMKYPVDKHGKVNQDLLRNREYIEFYVWAFSPKKFDQIRSKYAEAKGDDPPRSRIDLNVTLDGDPKYQKQLIEIASGTPFFLREDFPVDMRVWILDNGIRLFKHVSDSLGFSMKKDTLLEKLGLSSGSSYDDDKPTPQLNSASSYDDLIS